MITRINKPSDELILFIIILGLIKLRHLQFNYTLIIEALMPYFIYRTPKVYVTKTTLTNVLAQYYRVVSIIIFHKFFSETRLFAR